MSLYSPYIAQHCIEYSNTLPTSLDWIWCRHILHTSYDIREIYNLHTSIDTSMNVTIFRTLLVTLDWTSPAYKALTQALTTSLSVSPTMPLFTPMGCLAVFLGCQSSWCFRMNGRLQQKRCCMSRTDQKQQSKLVNCTTSNATYWILFNYLC